jgi:hypothetical protein
MGSWGLRFNFGFLGFLFLISSAALAAPPKEVLDAMVRIRRVGLGCPDRIWPGYSLRRSEITFVYSEAKTAFQWNAETDQLTEVPFDSLDPKAQSSIYWMDTRGETDLLTIGIDLIQQTMPERPIQTLIDAFVFHEMFHLHGQKGWAEGAESPRGTRMPMDASPRYYRAMAYEELLQALKSPTLDLHHLGKAKSWIKRWQTEYPLETLNSTDRIEATARFVEYRSLAIASLGCHATDGELLEAYMAKNEPFDLEEIYLGIDTESYMLGNLSVLALEKLGVERDFAEKIRKGASPLDLLIASIEARAETDNLEIKNAITEEAQSINETFFKTIEETLNAFSNPDAVRIALPAEALRGNFQPEGFYIHPVAGDKEAVWTPLGSPHLFKTQNEALSLNADTNAVMLLLDSTDQALGGNSWFTFMVKRSEITSKGSVHEIRSRLLNGSLEGNFVQGQNGTLYLAATKPESPSDPNDEDSGCDENLKP